MNVVKSLMRSKKFVVMAVAALAACGLKVGLPPEAADHLAWTVMILAATYIGAQGVADFGKEAEKVRKGE